MAERLLEIKGLKTHFHTDDGVVRAVDGVDLRIDRGRDPGRGRRVGLRQERDRALDHAADPRTRPAASSAAQILFEGRDLVDAAPTTQMRKIRGKRDLDDLPGADDLAEPGVHRRRARSPRRIRLHRGASAAGGAWTRPSRCSRRSASPTRERRVKRVPPPALGRHAPAGDDRHGPRPATRSCSSPTSRPPPWTSPSRPRSSTSCTAAGGARHGRPAHHPRPGRGRRDCRAGRGDVRRARSWRRPPSGSSSRAPAPLHPGPPALASRLHRPGELTHPRQRLDGHPRGWCRACSTSPPGLPVRRRAARVRQGRVRREGAGASREVARRVTRCACWPLLTDPRSRPVAGASSATPHG